MASSKKNFIIQYNGREGSSAIISALSAQKGVNVPIFEELDRYKFGKTNSPEDYPPALDNIFSTGLFEGRRTNRGNLHSPDPNDTVLATGFKWRIDDNIHSAARVMQKHNVNVFLLLRRDFLSMVCSVYIHNYGNKLQSNVDVPAHPQFIGTNDNTEELEKLERINQQKFRMVKPWFLKAAYDVSAARKRQVGKAHRLKRASIPVHMVYYEDFDGNQEEFITSFLAKIDIDISNTYTPFCGFEKVHKQPLSERIQGVDRMAPSWLFRRFQREYEVAVKAITPHTQA